MNSLAIVMYHYVRPIQEGAYPRIKGLELAGFRRQLDHLAANHAIVSPDEFLRAIRGETRLPEHACLLTFDDGYRDHVDHVLPELVKRGLKACFFPAVKPVLDHEMLDVNRVHFILACAPGTDVLVSDLRSLCLEHGIAPDAYDGHWRDYARASRYDPKEIVFFKRMLQHALPEETRASVANELFRRYVSSDSRQFAAELYISRDDAVRLVSAGMHVGNHGYGHLWLNRETPESQEREIDLSLAFLGDIGMPVRDWIMCYPYGGYNDATLAILKRKHCAAAMTTKVGQADLTRHNLLELPRFDTNDFPQ